MTQGFYPLTVLDTRDDIDGAAKTVMFDVPAHVSDRFQWGAGQHVSMRFDIDGQDLHRSYSISSSPVSGDPLQITVKRVSGGMVSNYINDHVQKGDVIDVMPPMGRFELKPQPKARRTYYFFAAGSGITPIFAMLQSVLMQEPNSDVHLIYGNKAADRIMLHDALTRLSDTYPHRFGLHHVWSAPSLWSGAAYWRKGRIDRDAIQAVIDEYPPYAQDVQYYVCGPGEMNGTVKSALMALDVPTNRIHMESYGGAAAAIDDGVMGVSAKAQVTLAGESFAIDIAAGETVLSALRAAGHRPPYSCQSGVCGACKAHLTQGQVHMRAHMALAAAEIANGDILTCQSVPTSQTIKVTYD